MPPTQVCRKLTIDLLAWKSFSGVVGLLGLAFTLSLALLGCGGGGGSASTPTANLTQNYHPAGWIGSHPGSAIAGLDACTKCHQLSVATAGSNVPTCTSTLCHHRTIPTWGTVAIHGSRAKLASGTDGGSLVSCQLCHGKDFSGGGGAKACASCHGVAAPHPAKPWHDLAGSNHATTNPVNAAICAQCHFPGAAANPAGHPATPAPAGTAPGCTNNTLCHGATLASHLVPFVGSGHTGITQTGFNGSCASCHAVSGASPVTSAPLCSACHQAGSPLVMANCASCHGKPPTGASFPNVAGAHGKHNALTGGAGACSTCHQNADTGTQTHYDHANGRAGKDSLRVGPGLVAFLNSYNGNAGPATFNPATLTCSNVSCHGGQTTPAWTATGSLSSATDCAKCHALGTAPGVPENNSAYSGFHALHMNSPAKLLCTECHSMANGSSGALGHLTSLGTAAMEGAAGETIALSGGTYSAAAKTCTVTCHGKTHAAFTWTGNGGVHPTGWIASHPGSALAGLNGCKACHGATLAGGPFSEPSCFTAACHHNTQPGYALAGSHGLRAKLAQGSSGGGLASCQACHGTAFASGLTASDGTTKACTTCHGVAAPHPAKPWHNATGSNHATTDATNAPVCAQCHYPGAVANPAGHPATPAPAGTAPGCFNNTLCHGTEATPHALGAVWTTATSAAFHGIAAKRDLAYCQSCHGNAGSTGFEGGAAATTKCSSCHSQARAHSDRWYQAPGAFPSYVASHRDAGNRSVACALCHDNTKGRTAPDVTAPSCFSASANAVACHVNGPSQPNHTVPFLGGAHTSASASTFTSDCSSCHGVSGTSPMATAPLCSVCHKAADPTLTASGAGTCLSCHTGTAGLPTGPGGASFPSIAGAHARHLGLPTTLTCDSCHAGSGAGTANHYTNANARTGIPAGPAPVSIQATFNAKSGTAAFTPSALTCSNVSCHGGQTTPAWTASGSINSAADCTKCHAVSLTAGDPQYNNAFGRHSIGTHAAHTCITCHNMANGSPGALAHFKYLNTPEVDGVATGSPSDQRPSGTIEFDATVTGLKTYTVTTNTQGNGGCTLTCHTHLHTPTYETWNASGSPHPIPFGAGQIDSQLNEHFQVTATTFSSDCSICHTYSGTSPNPSAPLCSVCHSRGNPVSDGYGTGTCQSCHEGASGLVGGPGGTSFPSKAGAHAKHLGLATQLTCDSCHTNAGTGSATHYLNADARIAVPTGPATVSIDPAFVAKTGGSIAFNPSLLTCSNVSCHGGQSTPNWQSGSLNASTQCTSCHATTVQAGTATQYNDAYGRHSMGTHNVTAAGSTIACTTCHNMNNGTLGALAHFKYLNTPAVDGLNPSATPADQLPSHTIVFDPAALTSPGTYSVNAGTQGNGGCALTCHSHIHVATVETWTYNGPPHPVSFLGGNTDTQGNGHFTATQDTFTKDCSLCHAYSGTSPNALAPSCNVCHTLANPTAVATGTGTCLSCHVGASGLPAGPTGAAFPSLSGKHAKHMALPTVLTCDTCHTNASTGSSIHYRNANARLAAPTGPGTVQISATYNAQSGGTASFNPTALTCSTVSCHGGQTTPSWQSGTLNSATQCGACHAINGGSLAAQFNDATGRHAWGTHALAAGAVAPGAGCTLCHDMSTARHFAYLETTAVSGVATGSPADQLPSTTIKFKTNDATYPITGAGTYAITTGTPEGDGGCALTCHSLSHVPATNHWDAPKGAAAHPVPFYSAGLSSAGNHHQTTTLTQFNTECLGCHDESGTSFKSGPVCTICHTLGSPLAAGKTAGTCLSCHVGTAFTTQGPSGAAWPSLKGAHLKHLSLLTFTRGTPITGPAATPYPTSPYPACVACHLDSLPGDSTNTHYSNASKRVGAPIISGPASVSIHPTFNAQPGLGAAFNGPSPLPPLTCSNVSCHGGQVTPAWPTGTLTVNADTYCIACHKAISTANSTQYNDATGRHVSPGNHTQTCDHCHDMSTSTNNRTGVVNHFKYLDTTAVRTVTDQLSSDTIKFGGGATPASGAMIYTVRATQGQGGCALSCHSQTHDYPTNTKYTWN